MKNKGIIKGILPSALSLIYIGAISLTLWLIYSITKYLPILQVSLILTMIVALSAIFALFGIAAKAHKPEREAIDESEETKKKKSGRLAYVMRVIVYSIAQAYNKVRKIVALVLSVDRKSVV